MSLCSEVFSVFLGLTKVLLLFVKKPGFLLNVTKFSSAGQSRYRGSKCNKRSAVFAFQGNHENASSHLKDRDSSEDLSLSLNKHFSKYCEPFTALSDVLSMFLVKTARQFHIWTHKIEDEPLKVPPTCRYELSDPLRQQGQVTSDAS